MKKKTEKDSLQLANLHLTAAMRNKYEADKAAEKITKLEKQAQELQQQIKEWITRQMMSVNAYHDEMHEYSKKLESARLEYCKDMEGPSESKYEAWKNYLDARFPLNATI